MRLVIERQRIFSGRVDSDERPDVNAQVITVNVALGASLLLVEGMMPRIMLTTDSAAHSARGMLCYCDATAAASWIQAFRNVESRSLTHQRVVIVRGAAVVGI